MPDAMIKVPSSKADFKSFASTVTASALMKPQKTMIAWVFAPQGGAIDEYTSTDMAYPHRGDTGAGANWHGPTIWFDPQFAQTSRMFGQEALASIKKWWVPSTNQSSGDPASYVNHPSQYLNDYHHAYWGNNLPRLQEVKKTYDPRNFMSNGQGIPFPAPAPVPAPPPPPTSSADDKCGTGCIIGTAVAGLVVGAVCATVASSMFGSKSGGRSVTVNSDDLADGMAIQPEQNKPAKQTKFDLNV